MKKLLKFILYILAAAIIAFALFLIYATIDDFKPDETILVYEGNNPDLLSDTSELTFLIWNIGYCGLNKEMDFFYDGGENVRPEENQVLENLIGIKKFITENKERDFIFLQEVDRESKRSYRTNQFDSIEEIFTERVNTFGINYDVFFVPTPPREPMGKVDGGLMSISKFKPTKSTRYSFPGNYNWPMSLFMLDRCFLVNRYNLTNEKELIIINTHNSAYDDGTLKAQQMEYLKTFLEKEYENGNYIIVGGDWNQCPPNFKNHFKVNKMDNEIRTDIDPEYLSEWTWVYDNTLPTNRRVTTPYKKGESLTTVIDFYLISPNIEMKSVKNIDVGFEFSDHQPVTATFKLK